MRRPLQRSLERAMAAGLFGLVLSAGADAGVLGAEPREEGGVAEASDLDRAEVRLLGRVEPLLGKVEEASFEALSLRVDGARVEIGWDRVVRMSGPGAEKAAEFLELAEKAWRSRQRLERGDFVLAEAGFEELFGVYAGRLGPTAQAVAEGALRCRLRRGAHASAIGPWLMLLQAGGGGRPVFDGVPAVVDPETGLCPAIPPIWTETTGVRQLAERGITLPSGVELTDERAALLGAWYRYAAAATVGERQGRPSNSDDPSVRLVAELVLAQHGTSVERSENRDRLRQRLERSRAGRATTPAWLEAWIYAAIGRSLVRENDEAERLRGVVTMLHLPARFADEQPFLAGLCLAEAAEAMDELGRGETAGLLRAELRRRYPGHPAGDDAPGGNGPIRGVTMNSPPAGGGQDHR